MLVVQARSRSPKNKNLSNKRQSFKVRPSLQEKKRILAIDYGTRRVGIAISDPTNVIAQGLQTLDHDKKLFGVLRALVSEYQVGTIVVGMPYNLKGEVGLKANEVSEFVDQLRPEISVPVTTWDERFTTSMARKAMREMGTKKMNRRQKGRVDRLASTLLLQSYLDSLRR